MDFNELDYIIILLLILSAISGYRKGLFLAVGSLVAVILAIGVAKYYRLYIVAYLNNKFNVANNLANFLEERLHIMAWNPINYNLHDLENSLLYQDNLFNEINNFLGSFAGEINPALYIADVLINVIVFLTVFLLMAALINSLFTFINFIVMRSPLAFVNRIMGIAVALLKTIIIIIVCVSLITPLIKGGTYLGWEGAIMSIQYINSSYFINAMKDIINSFQLMLFL